MGVISLWPLLEPVRQTKSLPELKGQKIAIDLSAWIMGCKRIAVASGYKNVYLRTIFLRTLDLLKCGIRPVFVCDGCIPKIKFDKVRSRCKGRSFGKSGPIFRDRSQNDTTRICRHLFECLGLPCLESEGEGEALCAFLNNQQIVDGCLTSDSDVLLYGARRVYRNFTKKKRVGYLEAYEAKDIHDQMQLDQRSLVGLALLLGCDYNQRGVQGVGIKTAVRMIREMQKTNNDTLQRMLSWRTNEELQDLQEQMDIFNEEKHCQECLHIVVGHGQIGCDLCGDNINVSEDLAGCECFCHSFLQKYVSHEEELKVREKALIDPNFPSQELIEEFLIPTESKDSQTDLNWQEPKFADLQAFVSDHLHWAGHVLFKKLVPILIEWKLNSSTFHCLEDLEPLRILKKHQRNYQPLYEVEWSKTSEDIWTKYSTYKCSVDRDLFQKCFPEMVESFELPLLPAKSAEGKEKLTVLNLSHRVTRSVLKNQGLTLSDIEDKCKDLDNSNDETGTDQCKTSVRQSKRLIEKNTGISAVRVTRSSIDLTNSHGLKLMTESLNKQNPDSIPKSFAGVKKLKKLVLKVKSIDSADTQDGKDLSAQMSPSSSSSSSSKYFNSSSVGRVTLERLPSIDCIKADAQVLPSINKDGLNRRDDQCSLSVDSEKMDCVEDTNKGSGPRSNDKEEIENTLNGRNKETETSDMIHECFDGVDIVDVNSNSMGSIMEGPKVKEMMRKGLNVMGSIAESPKSTEMMIGGSNSVDSIMEGSKVKGIMMECSNGTDSTLECSNGTDSTLECSNGTGSTLECSNGMDSTLEGSHFMESIEEGSKGTYMMGDLIDMDSIVEGSKIKDIIMEGSNGMDSTVESSNAMNHMEVSPDDIESLNGMTTGGSSSLPAFKIDTRLEADIEAPPQD